MYFFLLILIPKLLFSLELNLLCTNSSSDLKKVDVKDIFLLLDTDSKKIDLGGLSFYADDVSVTNSNISWHARNIQIYPDSTGEVTGIIGRYSGELVLNFTKEDENRGNSLVFNCRKFEIREKKF